MSQETQSQDPNPIMTDVLNVIIPVYLIKRPMMTCCVGSFSANLGNSKMVEIDTYIICYSFNDSSLLKYTLSNINSTIDVHRVTAFQPADGLSIYRLIASHHAVFAAQYQSMSACSLPHST